MVSAPPQWFPATRSLYFEHGFVQSAEDYADARHQESFVAVVLALPLETGVNTIGLGLEVRGETKAALLLLSKGNERSGTQRSRLATAHQHLAK